MKKIEKTAIIACSLLLLVLPSISNGGGLELRFFGGAGFLSPHDINKGVKGWSDLHAEFITRMGYSQEGETRPIQLGMDLGGDLLIHFTPHVAIGIGSGYIQATRDSEIIFAKDTTITMSDRSKISAVPVRAGLFFTIPLNRVMSASLNFGSAYYMAKYNWDWNSGDLGELHDSVKANGFGFHGGIGFEFNLSSDIAFFLEGTARYVKIKGFEGTETGREGPDTWQSEGTLYYVEGTEFPSLLLRESMPTGYRVAREAEVDLSGLAVIAGIKLKF
jgi:hypothetical protein